FPVKQGISAHCLIASAVRSAMLTNNPIPQGDDISRAYGTYNHLCRERSPRLRSAIATSRLDLLVDRYFLCSAWVVEVARRYEADRVWTVLSPEPFGTPSMVAAKVAFGAKSLPWSAPAFS